MAGGLFGGGGYDYDKAYSRYKEGSATDADFSAYVDATPDLKTAWADIEANPSGTQGSYWIPRGASSKAAFGRAHAAEDAALQSGTYQGGTDVAPWEGATRFEDYLSGASGTTPADPFVPITGVNRPGYPIAPGPELNWSGAGVANPLYAAPGSDAGLIASGVPAGMWNPQDLPALGTNWNYMLPNFWNYARSGAGAGGGGGGGTRTTPTVTTPTVTTSTGTTPTGTTPSVVTTQSIQPVIDEYKFGISRDAGDQGESARRELYDTARQNLETIDPNVQADIDYVNKYIGADRRISEVAAAQKRIDAATQKAYDANPNAFLGLMTGSGTSTGGPGSFTMPDKPTPGSSGWIGPGVYSWNQGRNEGKGEWVYVGRDEP